MRSICIVQFTAVILATGTSARCRYDAMNEKFRKVDTHLHAVLAVDDRHVALCEYNGSVARIICVAVATLANEKLLERASDNDLLLCRKSTSNKTCYRQ